MSIAKIKQTPNPTRLHSKIPGHAPGQQIYLAEIHLEQKKTTERKTTFQESADGKKSQLINKSKMAVYKTILYFAAPGPEKLLNTFFFWNLRKVLVPNAAVKKQSYSVHLRVPIAEARLIQMLSTTEDDSCDADEETSDTSLFEQFLNTQQGEEDEEEEIAKDMIVEVNYNGYESD